MKKKWIVLGMITLSLTLNGCEIKSVGNTEEGVQESQVESQQANRQASEVAATEAAAKEENASEAQVVASAEVQNEEKPAESTVSTEQTQSANINASPNTVKENVSLDGVYVFYEDNNREVERLEIVGDYFKCKDARGETYGTVERTAPGMVKLGDNEYYIYRDALCKKKYSVECDLGTGDTLAGGVKVKEDGIEILYHFKADGTYNEYGPDIQGNTVLLRSGASYAFKDSRIQTEKGYIYYDVPGQMVYLRPFFKDVNQTPYVDTAQAMAAATKTTTDTTTDLQNAGDLPVNLQSQYLYPDIYERVLDQSDREKILAAAQGLQLPTDKSIFQMIVNEIYAMHGYKFKNEEIYQYFAKYDWYQLMINSDILVDDMSEIEPILSQMEIDNIKILQEFDKQ